MEAEAAEQADEPVEALELKVPHDVPSFIYVRFAGYRRCSADYAPTVTRTLLPVLFSVLAVSCAERAPLALHGEIVFPPPDQQTCASDEASPSQLHVTVNDELGAVFPGAAVYAAPMAQGEALVTATTDDSGVAVLEVPSPGDYAITVVIAGFEPQVLALQLRAGCVGTAQFTLQVGPMAVEK